MRHAPVLNAPYHRDVGRRHLPHVVMPLLQAQARKAQRRLPSPPMLLGQVHRELVQDLRRRYLVFDAVSGGPKMSSIGDLLRLQV